MRIQAFAMGLVLAWATVGAARADEVSFTISNGGKTVASFELSLNPTPKGPIPSIFNYSFSLASVPATVGGSRTTLANLTFYSALGGGGFFADGVFNFSGQQLYSYSGLANSPMFTPGSYQLVDAHARKTETVTLTELFDPPPDPPALSIPEPSTWAMLLFGFVALSYAGYRKARTPTIN